MADMDVDRAGGGHRNSHQGNNRKRRYRGVYESWIGEGASVVATEANYGADDDEVERRPQRRRYEEPVASRLRREITAIAKNVRTVWITSQYTVANAIVIDYANTSG
jgi:hypothetical protein